MSRKIQNIVGRQHLGAGRWTGSGPTGSQLCSCLIYHPYLLDRYSPRQNTTVFWQIFYTKCVQFVYLGAKIVDKHNSMMMWVDTSLYIWIIVLEFSYCFRRQNVPTLPLFYVNTHSIFIWKQYIGLDLTI